MKNEILAPVLESDEVAYPRYNIVSPEGAVLHSNIRLALQNAIVQAGTPYDVDSVLPLALALELGLNANATVAEALEVLLNTAASADPAGTAASAVSAHNTDSGAHASKQNKITASGLLKGDGLGGVSAAAAGTDFARVPVVLPKTLTAAGWSSNQQAISDAAIYSATAPGDVRIAQSASDEQFEAWNKAQPRVISQAIGSITLKITGDVPTVDIPVIVEVR